MAFKKNIRFTPLSSGEGSGERLLVLVQQRIRKASFIFFALLSSFAFAQNYTCNPAASTVKFKIKNAGMEVKGGFQKFECKIRFNPDSLQNASIVGVISVNSINTGIDMRDGHLKEKDYFDAKTYPYITFKSTSIIKKSATLYMVKGMLKIKDVENNIELPLTFESKDNSGIFKSSITLNRLDYHVGESSWTLADDVMVEIVIMASP